MVSSILFVVLENAGTEVLICPRNPSYALPLSIHDQLDEHLSNTTNGQSLILNVTTYTFAFNLISRWGRLHYSHLQEEAMKENEAIHSSIQYFFFTQTLSTEYLLCTWHHARMQK